MEDEVLEERIRLKNGLIVCFWNGIKHFVQNFVEVLDKHPMFIKHRMFFKTKPL